MPKYLPCRIVKTYYCGKNAEFEAERFRLALLDMGYPSEVVELVAGNGYRVISDTDTECRMVDFLTD